MHKGARFLGVDGTRTTPGYPHNKAFLLSALVDSGAEVEERFFEMVQAFPRRPLSGEPVGFIGSTDSEFYGVVHLFDMGPTKEHLAKVRARER